MRNLLIVGAGGFIGSACRFLLSGAVQRWLPAARLPLGTVSVNILGCLLIGLIAGYSQGRAFFTTEVRHFIFAGVMGGFTTFSAFAYETLWLHQSSGHTWAAANILLQVAGCLAAAWAGGELARFV